jgi:UPF0755 protein
MKLSPFMLIPRQARGVIRWRWLVVLALCFALCVGGLAAAAGWWVNQPLHLNNGPVNVRVEPGTSPRELAQQCVAAGVPTSPWLLYQWFRWSGKSRGIKAGQYVFKGSISPRQLLNRFISGQTLVARATLIEGWTFARWRRELAQQTDLVASTQGWSDAQIMAALGAPQQHPEGRFLPDTYVYGQGSKDVDVMRLAYRAMSLKLDSAWRQFKQSGANSTCPLSNPEQLLTLASIVEKETGDPRDRTSVAAVFCNRLRIGMPLQTDPTVIYGLGDAFDGNLRKVHLKTDTPYNTYTRGGLPPTPISMPGVAALQAVLTPADTNALYFVARGDGTSVFSHTLSDHNRAVNQYQRKILTPPKSPNNSRP